MTPHLEVHTYILFDLGSVWSLSQHLMVESLEIKALSKKNKN